VLILSSGKALSDGVSTSLKKDFSAIISSGLEQSTQEACQKPVEWRWHWGDSQ
jgi:hypothetical protein